MAPFRRALTRALAGILLAVATAAHAATPAFRGAQGGGAGSKGGRGGAVIAVTNLADSGPGSLRACVTAKGPRTCIFKVSGVIVLRSSLILERANSYLTVAGHTAPGGGIAIAGGTGAATGSDGLPSSPREPNNMIYVDGAHDVTIRYVRLWRGYNEHAADPSHHGSCGVNLTVYATRHLILDHVTAVWAMDKSISIWANRPGDVQNVTIGYSISGEGIGSPVCNDTNVLTGGESIAATDTMTDIDLHHDFLVSASHRFPLFKSKSGRLVNNVIFNWDRSATAVSGGAWVDVVGNYYAPGPSFRSSSNLHPIQVTAHEAKPGCTTCGPAGTPSVYLANNVAEGQQGAGESDWDHLVAYADYEGASECARRSPVANVSCDQPWHPLYRPLWIPDGRAPAGIDWKRARPLAAATRPGSSGGPPLETDDPFPIRATVLTGNGRNLLRALLAANAPEPVGASRRLDCLGRWVVNRDASDRRLVNYLLVSAAGAKVNQSRVTGYNPGGFPSLGPPITAVCPPGQADNAQCACADTDGDGMPDVWEAAHGLDPKDPADGLGVSAGGFTNLERFLNGK